MNQYSNEKFSKLKLHFIYCTVILIFIIIAIATVKWTPQPNFTEFLSNAATMTSLVLGLVAIFYSFIANDGLSKSLGSIGTVSEEIKRSKEQIQRQVTAGVETTKAAERSAESIEVASLSIESSLTSLSTTLTAIRNQTEVLHESLSGLPTRLDKIETKLDAAKSLGLKPEQTLPVNSTKTIDSGIVESFLATSPVSANVLTYACVLSHRHKKEFKLSEFCTAIGSKMENYYDGYLQAMDSLQIIDYSKDSRQKKIYNIVKLNNYLIENTERYINSYLENYFKQENPQFYERWINAMKEVEKLFE